MTHGAAKDTTSRAASTWPMPLPYPEVFMKDGYNVVDAPWKRLVCLQVVVFNWLVLNRPRKAPECLRIGLSARQWSAVKNLEFLARDGNTPELVLVHDMGRAAAKFEGFQDELAALCRAASFLHAEESGYFASGLTHSLASEAEELRCGSLVGALGETAVLGAKPLVASRLTFPAKPCFNPRPFFDEATLKRYDMPLSDGFDPSEAGEPPRVQVRATRENKIALLHKMAQCGMLQPLLPGTFSDRYRSGLFAVHKDESKDRMVLDGRPANMLDKGQKKWCAAMASASALAGICLAEDKLLIGSGEDLKDYFYQFVVNDERTARNVLACDLSAEEAKAIFGADLKWQHFPMQVGLSTLAMGDKCACEFAQCAHIALCLQNDVCLIDEIISLRGSIPRGLLQVGIIVDDLVILEQVLRKQVDEDGWFAQTVSAERVRNVRKGYERAHLLNNPKKAFQGELLMKFWGCEIDGCKGILRCSSSRLWPTVLITMRAAMLGLATVGLLEALAGCWVSLLNVRRRLYCLLDCLFEPLGLSDQPRQVVRLSPQLKDEMVSLCVVGALAAVNLRAQHASMVSATDASMTGMGSVRADLPLSVAQELARHCLKKGNWSKLLPPGKAWLRQHDLLDEEDELPADSYVCHPFWEVLARGLEYREAWRLRVERPLHINILELRAFLREERFLCSFMQRLRTFHGLDSQVCLGALVKGRAASKALNAELQRALAYPIGADLYGNYMFFQTQFNRADAPSRGEDVDVPDIELPPWYTTLAEGDVSLFDVWMRQQAPSFLPDEPPFHELCSASKVVLKPASKCGRRRLKRRRACNSKTTCDSNTEDPFFDDSVASLLTAEVKDLLRSFPKRQFLFGRSFKGFTTPGALDLFSGSFGVAKQMIQNGAPFVLTFEWNRSPDEDLLKSSVREKILKLLRLGAFLTFGAAPICSSFSRAVTPPVRNNRFPRGMPGLRVSMRLKVAQGNSHSDFVYECLEVCFEFGVFYFVENPDTSWWWWQAKWKAYNAPDSPFVFRCCFCRFGTRWRKATRIATNTMLAGKTMWCQCRREHVRLRGMHPIRKIPMTRVAQPYPAGLSRLLAIALCVGAKWCKAEKLNVAQCAKAGDGRIGEASNPGPAARRFGGERVTLESMPIQTARTLALERRLLEEFLHWCNRELRTLGAEVFFDRVPSMLPEVLRTYGDLLYQRGGSLSNYRHLLLASQRWKPVSKPYMCKAWELVERWEAQTPVVHRSPVPEVLVKAMCAVAWQLGWMAWVGATLLAFYGAGRLGEVLRCSREDLLLPEDLLQESGGATFLRLRNFKSRNRQPAKVQHMKITDATASKLISKIFKHMPLDSALFDGTAYQYRKRWDLLLQMLEIPRDAALTPGGLRAGAAVFHYRNGKGVPDLLWLMRLRSQTTLEAYLQEVAALNTFAKLSAQVRQSVLLSASTFPFLVNAKRSMQSQDKRR